MFEKLRCLPALKTFLADFRQMTGLKLSLRNDLGTSNEPETLDNPLCQFLRGQKAGRQLCQRAQQELMASATECAASCRCDAGLHEVAVPVRFGTDLLGYFVFGGIHLQPPTGIEVRRVQHLLEKSGLEVSRDFLTSLIGQAQEVPNEALAAYTRIVSMAAQQFALQITDHFMQKTAPLPALAHKARRYLRSHALTEECSLKTVAAHCFVSEAHLSRVFHSATGLTITDYIARYRIEHALGLIQHTDRPITEIAFESGFQSISQFNRSFKKLNGTTPRAMRKGP